MSFGWLGVFRRGAWREFRSFVLQERRDVARNIAVINGKLRRIGEITMYYKREEDATSGTTRVTEERVGFTVSKGSSLERLIQAYVALGGNPLNISQFFVPDKALVVNDTPAGVQSSNQYPYGGVAGALSAEYNEPLGSYGVYTGGFLPLRKFPPLRTGGRRDVDTEAEPFVNYNIALRKATAKAIKYKLHDLEAKIIKLCDLREQLLRERDELLPQAWGGASRALNAFNRDRFAQSLRSPKIVDLIDSLFYLRDENGHINFTTTNPSATAKYPNLFEDILPDEANHAL